MCHSEWRRLFVSLSFSSVSLHYKRVRLENSDRPNSLQQFQSIINFFFFFYRLARWPWDADKKMVQEVGTASKAEYGVGQLEREVS